MIWAIFLTYTFGLRPPPHYLLSYNTSLGQPVQSRPPMALQVIAEGPNIVIHVDDAQLNAMNDWCKTHHGQSGLTDACRKSEISLAQAEAAMLEFVAQHVPPGKCPLAGNSIHADKKFLDKYPPPPLTSRQPSVRSRPLLSGGGGWW